MDSQNIRTHNGFMQRMAASIHMAICSSSNPFVEQFLGGAAGVRHELAQLQCLRDHIAASPSVEPHPMFSEVLNKYLFGWGEAEKFLACTVGKGCEYWRERFYSSMRKQSCLAKRRVERAKPDSWRRRKHCRNASSQGDDRMRGV